MAEWQSGWQPSLCIAVDLPHHRWRGATWSSESSVRGSAATAPELSSRPVTEGKPQRLDIQR